MRTARRVSLCLFVVLSFTVSVFAQITAAASPEKLRFASPGDTAQIRVLILSPSGEALFDSEWRDGNVLDWPMATALADGPYRCTISVKDLAGEVSQKEAALSVRGGQVVIEPVAENENPKITILVHDDKDGAIVNTSGDLSFRFGKFFAGRDAEKMRLTADGDLQVEGMIHAEKGITFSDGTILRASDGEVIVERAGRVVQSIMRSQPNANPRRLVPTPNVALDYQFKVDATGVHIGTTNAFGLDVAGNVTLASNLVLPATTSSSAGVIKQGIAPFAHSFGSNNTFLGVNAGNFAMTGAFNTAVGNSTLGADTTGSNNTAIGGAALSPNTTGSSNTANGVYALHANTTGFHNTAVGVFTLESNVDGAYNTAVGSGALGSLTTGIRNTAVGYAAGSNLTTGDDNIDIGSAGMAGESATIRVGNSGTHTRTFIAGIRDRTTGSQDAVNVMIDSSGQLGTVSSSRRLKFDIADMGKSTDHLMQLRPVTFRYLKYGDEAARQYGLIAEEVAEVYPEMVTRNKAGEIETVMYQFLAPMLLNEVQRERREIDDLKSTIETLQRRLQALEKRMN